MITKYQIGDIIVMEFGGTSIHYLIEDVYRDQALCARYSLRLLEENIIKETFVYIVDQRPDIRKLA